MNTQQESNLLLDESSGPKDEGFYSDLQPKRNLFEDVRRVWMSVVE